MIESVMPYNIYCQSISKSSALEYDKLKRSFGLLTNSFNSRTKTIKISTYRLNIISIYARLSLSSCQTFRKAETGEYVPIESIEMTRETVAWSPKLKQSIYITPGMPDAGVLKRVREVNVLRIYEQAYRLSS